MPKVTQQTPHGSEEQPVTQEEVNQMKLMIHAKNQETEAKDAELEKARKELEAMKREIAAKSENKDVTETHQQSATRRMSLQPSSDIKNTLKMLTKITADVKPQIPHGIIESITAMRGQKWPQGTRMVCLDFNAEGCTKNFAHYDNNEKITKLHICGVCVKLFDIGLSHSALNCATLQIVDKRLEEQNQMQN